MLEVRWRKLARDLRHYRARAILAIAAIAVGAFAIMAVLVAYTVLSRELDRGYRATHPATATLVLERPIGREGLEALRSLPGVEAAELRTTLRARVRPAGADGWTPMVLFVVADFDAMQVSTFRPEAGRWPPPPGEVLIERSGLPVLGRGLGSALDVRLGDSEGRVTIGGTVHDPGQAPGWMDGVVNAYATPEGAAQLGSKVEAREVRIVLAAGRDRVAAETTARALAERLAAMGNPIARIEVPPPGQHPHQAQMNALLAIVAAFGFFALLLAGVLAASTMSALLTQQIRQIGVMKAVGASTSQLVRLYLVFVLILEIAALIVALPAGYAAGGIGAAWAARSLNFALADPVPAAWTWAAAGLIGLIVPALLALGPVRRGARISVREAIADTGGAREGNRLVSAITGLSFLPRPVLLGLANAFRRQKRFALTLGMLAVSGAMVMTAFNVARSWELTLDRAFEGRRYDLDVRLDRPAAPERLLQAARALSGVAEAETWAGRDVARIHAGGADVVTVYPGAVHGGLAVLAPPVDSTLMRSPLIEGRRLVADDPSAVVVNRKLLAEEPDLAIGGTVDLRIDGQATRWHVIGLVDEPGAPPTLYTTPAALAAVVGPAASGLRLRLADRTPAAEAATAASLERALEAGGLAVASLQRTTVLRSSFDRHIVILISALLGMGGLIALVGGLGLAATLGINVAERTREFGVMQAVGARPRDIFHVVESEAIAIGLSSWLAALVLSVPLTHALAHVGGHVGLGRSLDIAFAPLGMAAWLGLVVLLALIAGIPPARGAARRNVRETLAYE